MNGSYGSPPKAMPQFRERAVYRGHWLDGENGAVWGLVARRRRLGALWSLAGPLPARPALGLPGWPQAARFLVVAGGSRMGCFGCVLGDLRPCAGGGGARLP